MDSFTLVLLPKIDFNYEHNNSTTATLRELTDLYNVYLNTFSKYRRIQHLIHVYYMPRSLYLKASENLSRI
jgi:hypothetical protein